MDGLHYEIRGDGPMVLLIPGGNGDAGFYEPLAKALDSDFTVVTYDRRGFSRSPVHAVAEDRLASDTDDARSLLESLSQQPADVFGSSSGGIVALDLVCRHPNSVRTVVAHEPPVVSLLADGDRYLDLFDDIYDTFRSRGAGAAMRKFGAAAGFGPPRIGSLEFFRMLPLIPRIRRNIPFWLQHELRQYTRFAPDLSLLRSRLAHLVLAGGEESRERFPYRATAALAEAVGTTVADLPGGHAGYRTHATEFASRLRGLLAPQRSR
jgi:pimeloyl-ACP methyl ester carboxylesterase